MWQPSESHDLLLQASLLKGERFHAAWQQWIARVDVDQLDGPSQRLFPLLFSNLLAHRIEHPAVAVAKRHQLMAFIRNERLLFAADGVLSALRAAGIEMMLLKGGGLAPRYYAERALRPMNDLDILVRPAQLERAQALLAGSGWEPLGGAAAARRMLFVSQACAFRNADKIEIDLHAHALNQCCVDELDTALWAASEQVSLREHALRAPCATDQIFLAAMHGRVTEAFRGVPSIHWAADAYTILAKEPSIDYERMLAFATRWQLTLPLADSLEYLAVRLHAPVPASVITRLKAIRPSGVERIEQASYAIASPNLQQLMLFGSRYLRLRQNPQFLGARGFNEFLRNTWNLDSPWQTVPALSSKLAKNAARIAKHYGRRKAKGSA